MGGSSGGGRRTLGNIRDLEIKAKKELERGTRRNTFLSFDSDDINEVNLLRGHAINDRSEIEFIDRSVKQPFNSKDDEYTKKKISERIRQCSLTVVYVSEKTRASDWVDWEVKKSLQLGKKVIAVHKGDQAPTNLPSCIASNGIKLIKWGDLAEYL